MAKEINHQEMYDSLVSLTEESKTFFYSDQIKDEKIYRIFNYRIASYSEFLLPYALECRGVTFEIDGNGKMIKLVSLPMAKFFNIYENPITENLDFSKVKKFMVKSDGSLISTYIHHGSLYLKSKGSFSSDQAIDAMKWLSSNNSPLNDVLLEYTTKGYTCNLEWVSPNNRIVLKYPKPKLHLLNIRNNTTGEYLDLTSSNFDIIRDYVIKYEIPDDPQEFVEKIPNMKGIEGYVVEFEDGYEPKFVKIKTNEYFALHRIVDSVNSPKALFMCVLEEATDDVRSMFHNDKEIIERIDNMERYVESLYNDIIGKVDTFVKENMELDFKDFAIKCKSELVPEYFSLAMNQRRGKEVSYKEFLIKNYRKYVDDKYSDI